MTELARPAAESTDAGREPRPSLALCLSGGGYRAMLFDVGALCLDEWPRCVDELLSSRGGNSGRLWAKTASGRATPG
jgi:hypothetical protein